jgi:enediyne biosynthesis protein E4
VSDPLRSLLFLAGIALSASACNDPVPATVRFAEVPSASGFRFRHELPGGRLDSLPKSAQGGLALLDFDGDGRIDIYCVNGGWDDALARAERPKTLAANRLFRNLGSMRFEDVTEKAGVGDTGFGLGACTGDFDNDGDVDVFVCNYGRSVLYANRGDGGFDDVTDAAGIPTGFHAGATFLDFDRDGHLDLFIGQYVDPQGTVTPGAAEASEEVLPPMAYLPQPAVLLRNRGDGTFEDVTRAAGLAKEGRAMGVLATDLDDDGWIDVLVANDGMANFAWRNGGDGTFRDIAPTKNLAYGLDGGERASMGVSSADVDGDGRLDYLIPDTMGGAIYVARDTWFAERAADWGMAAYVTRLVGWADIAIDADNDGSVDVYKTHGDLNRLLSQESQLFLNGGNGSFQPLRSDDSPRVDACARGGVAADFDDDGRVDVLVLALNNRARLLRNVTDDAGGWVRLRLAGTKSNRSAIGARVTARVGDRPVVQEVSSAAGYISAPDLRLHFGLGAEDVLADVEVRWPSGETQSFGALEAGRDHVLTEE